MTVKYPSQDWVITIGLILAVLYSIYQGIPWVDTMAIVVILARHMGSNDDNGNNGNNGKGEVTNGSK